MVRLTGNRNRRLRFGGSHLLIRYSDTREVVGIDLCMARDPTPSAIAIAILSAPA